MKKLAILSLAITAVGLMGIRSASAQLVIDDFSTDSTLVSNDGSAPGSIKATTTIPVPPAAMNQRILEVSAYAPTSPAWTMSVAGGNLTASSGSGATGGLKLNYWNGWEGNQWFDTPIFKDIQFLSFDIAQNTSTRLQITAQFTDYDGSWGITTQSSVSQMVASGAGTFLMDVSGISSALQLVDTISFSFDFLPFGEDYSQAWGQTVEVSAITGVVPEPSTFALLGVGVVAFLARRRRS